MHTDPISDMLIRLKNANNAKQDVFTLPASKEKESILQILKQENFIEDFERIKSNPQDILKVKLKYINGKRVIRDVKKVSKPGLRIYVGKNDIPRVLGGFGLAILSTPKGIMSDRRARKEGIGGELLCMVW
ncbi:ribosomal protein S8 [Thermodesulfobium narugense DSM 14796]|uniref:Small ribosomal subunit protein uS8 n=1 Tax=Thermodesulfobium narugense DSM 14796 TaxID=747365 RepID=M1E6G3_9BACT|nr:30S ribosomal protein S8 [Thermodesulfobium narugense]AEE14158.1 ribosomal protein S8 [Thermodesulfobium narugense DSM 14796]